MYKLYKTCTQFRLKMAWNLKCMFFVPTNNVQTIQYLHNWLTKTTFVCFLYIQIMYKLLKTIKLANWNSFAYFLYIHTMYKLYKIYTNVNWIIYAAAVCFLHIQNFYILYFSNFCINSDAIFCSIFQFCIISGPIFSCLKRFKDDFCIIDLFIINLFQF